MATKRTGKESGELQGDGPVYTALIRGNTFGVKAVQYVVVDGLAMFEGDIVLGTAQEVTETSDRIRSEMASGVAHGVAISGAQFRWPNCRVPFTIDPTLPNQARVNDAIAHWEANTSYRFVAHTTESDFVTFRPGSGCSATVGRRGGQQFVNLASGCTTGNVIHEIGHVIGLWHEQSREDRDLFVAINWDKITPGFEHNFNQHISDGDDIGVYDFGSIMHYPLDAFSVDGSNTITPIATVPSGVTIGQRTRLSAGDIAAANSLCAARPAHIDLPFHIDIPRFHFDLPPPHFDLPPPHVDLPPPHFDLPRPHFDLPPPHIDLPVHADIPRFHFDIPPPHVDIPAPHIDIPAPHIDIPAPHIDIPAPHIDIPAPHIDIPAPHIDLFDHRTGIGQQMDSGQISAALNQYGAFLEQQDALHTADLHRVMASLAQHDTQQQQMAHEVTRLSNAAGETLSHLTNATATSFAQHDTRQQQLAHDVAQLSNNVNEALERITAAIQDLQTRLNALEGK